jgi:hypothetical protein
MRAFYMHNITHTRHGVGHNIFQQHSPPPFSVHRKPTIFYEDFPPYCPISPPNQEIVPFNLEVGASTEIRIYICKSYLI